MNSRMKNRRDFLKTAGLSASALTISGRIGQTGQLSGRKQNDRPNILWITCEDIGPKLGCYGDSYSLTPNLDRFAEKGTLYSRAFAVAPVCSPSRSCLITGVYATSLGTQHLRSRVPLPDEIQTLPHLLRKAGYYCSNNYKEDYNFKDDTMWDESSPTAHWRRRKSDQPFFSVFNIMTTHQGQINGTDDEFYEKYTSKLSPNERHDPAQATLPPYYPDTPVTRNIFFAVLQLDHSHG